MGEAQKRIRLLRIEHLPGIASVYTTKDNSSGSIWTTSHRGTDPSGMDWLGMVLHPFTLNENGSGTVPALQCNRDI